MENGLISVVVETDKDKTFIIEVPSSIKHKELRELLKNEITKTSHFYFVYKNKRYESGNNKEEVIHINEGTKIYLEVTLIPEAFIAHFHENLNLDEADKKVEELTGILNLCNLKYIVKYIDLEKIKKKEIKEIMKELKEGIYLTDNPQKDIKESLSRKDGSNILTFINYLDKKIKFQDVKDLISLVDKNQRKQMEDYWSVLSKYQDFNKLFEKDFSKMIENSYIDYSLVSVQIYQHKRRREFVQNLKNCDNVEVRYLLHGTQIDPISLILTDEFKYTRKAFYGMGVYFTDMIDYVSFYCGGNSLSTRRKLWNKIIPVGDTISCIASEVYYDINKKNKIYKPSVVELDHFPTYDEIEKDYKEQMVEENGINFIEVETIHGHALESEGDIDFSKKKGNFIGNEYVITEMDQILPLYGLTLRRNEYLVVWRDPCFDNENEWNDFLEERKMFIYKESKMNAFFVGSVEKGLEIVQRKRYNKIILISNIGKDLSGKKFVEVARKILGFDAMVLFFSNNNSHFGWLQKFPNALYTCQNNFYEKYITNYNKNGLIQLKKEVEKEYKIKLNFTNDFLSFPNFANDKQYKDLLFKDINENYRRVLIQSKRDKKALYMEEGKVKFVSYQGSETSSFIWYITIVDNEITLYSNNFYLDADKNEGIVKGFPYMKRWKCERKVTNYSIYFEDKNNMLTIDEDKALLRNENKNQKNQLFTFIDIQGKKLLI
jgi:hypothetical protein